PRAATLSLHDALPISAVPGSARGERRGDRWTPGLLPWRGGRARACRTTPAPGWAPAWSRRPSPGRAADPAARAPSRPGVVEEREPPLPARNRVWSAV